MSDPDDYLRYEDNIPDNGKDQAPDSKIAFSRRLSFSVIRLGVNDSEIARRSGIPRSAISRYRNAESMPEAKYVFALAEVLHVSAKWLITGEGSRHAPDVIDEHDSGEGRLLGLYRSLPTDEREHLLRTASMMWDGAAQRRMQSVARPTTSIHDRKSGFREKKD